jgi:simple sugar transport system permease protein
VLFGLAGLVLAERYGSRSAFRPDTDIELPSFGLGFLADVPVLGPLLSSNDIVVWAMLPAVVATGWALARTRWGLRIRAAGGDAVTATTLGISVPAVRVRAGVVAGALSGLGGAHLSIAAAGLFSPGISAGRGYIALAAVYFGRARPVPTTLATLIYVVIDATQTRLQLRLPGIPVHLIETLPYVAVIIALTLSAAASRRTRAI